MHLIVANLRPAQVESVRQALADVHVTRLTICDAHGYDRLAAGGSVADPGAAPELEPAGSAAGPNLVEDLVQEAVLEIAVNDDFLDRTVDTIAAALEPESIASRLFVLPMHDAIQIYRTVRGPEAV